MKKFSKILLILLALVIVLTLLFLYKYGPNFNIYLFPPSVEQYVDDALTKMNNGINTHSREWNETKSEVCDVTKNMKSYEETHDILNKASKVAGGKHSFLIMPEEVKEISHSFDFPQVKIEDNILYIKLTPIMLANQEESQKYVDIVTNSLRNDSFKGVIIDLSNNTGGDMYPMITSVSALIPDGKILVYKNAAGATSDIVLKDGKLNNSFNSIVGLDKKINDLPVAIIINEMTGSSGEMVALSFRGLDNIKFFGKESAGYTSVNTQMNLYDGAILQLTTGSIVDRTGKEYLNEPIKPDIYSDNPMADATDWINGIISIQR